MKHHNDKKHIHYKSMLIDDSVLCNKILEILLSLEWTQDTYVINGKSFTPKRKTLMYGKDYTYSGVKKIGLPFTNLITVLANEVEKDLQLEKGFFNGCLLNLYQDGDTQLSYHKDNEPELDKDAPIVSLAFGSTRKFYLKDDITNAVIKYEHHSGEIIVMCKEVQDKYRHSVPKVKNVDTPRVSLTFRKFV